MNELADDNSNVLSVRKKIIDLKAERQRLAECAQNVQAELSVLKNKIRTSGYMPKDQYAMLCAKQEALDRQKKIYERQVREVKLKIAEAHIEETELISDKRQKLRIADDAIDTPLRRELVVMRQHYQEFSADLTRVSSMRQMAAEFSIKLDHIIKASLAYERRINK